MNEDIKWTVARTTVRTLAVITYVLAPFALIYLLWGAAFWTGMAYRDSQPPPWPKYILAYSFTLAYLIWGCITHLWEYLLPIAGVVVADVWFRKQKRGNHPTTT